MKTFNDSIILNVINMKLIYDSIMNMMNIQQISKLMMFFNGMMIQGNDIGNIKYESKKNHTSIIDFIYMTMYIGNDFLPSQITTHIK